MTNYNKVVKIIHYLDQAERSLAVCDSIYIAKRYISVAERMIPSVEEEENYFWNWSESINLEYLNARVDLCKTLLKITHPFTSPAKKLKARKSLAAIYRELSSVDGGRGRGSLFL